jgi:hypothetical protein
MEKKTTEKKDYVTIGPLFYDGKRYKDPVNVIINGVKYSVPRGKKVEVPSVVAEVLQQSAEQDAYAAEINAKMQQEQVQTM